MKKVILILIITSILLTSCSPAVSKETQTVKDPNITYSDESGDSYDIKKLPFDMKYNGVNVQLLSVDLYQDKVEHSYNLYAVISLDISKITEDDLYWIDKNKEIEPAIYITNKQNDIKFDSMQKLCTYDDGGIRKIAFWMNDEYRYSLSPSDICASVDIESKKTYDYKGKKLNKSDSYMYSIDSCTDFKSTDTIDSGLCNAMNEAFENIKNIYRNMLK